MKELKKLGKNFLQFISDINYYFAPFALVYIIVGFIFAGLAGYHRDQTKQLQDQLEIQKGHTSWFKMEAERNLNAFNNCAIENKENKRKLEEIKSILQFNN